MVDRNSLAVMSFGGFEHIVRNGDTVAVPFKESLTPKEQITISEVRFYQDEQSTLIGTPKLDGITIKATVLAHKKGGKVHAFKKRRRKGFKKNIGARARYTLLKVTSIEKAI